ncbi:(E2-independent) E3 ubiquitin-conjugating enzyme FATS isoform X4 [Tupaia chinensis]|uniref:(E2-independent) E3 ubiquitin-conjugating enzyme FATS isoform X4 n=1 Tax=Tupaia chinensis TaxID=246437 RepID=UPI000FFB6FA2|nr:(E2-independent) E3 ubiquitin-conjugating enzyme FATS isoform X4 [Tupaia chinensis]
MLGARIILRVVTDINCGCLFFRLAKHILVIKRPLKLSKMTLKRQWNMIKLSEEGLRDNYYSTNDQISLKNHQSDVTEKKSDFTKETLEAQNTKMISSIVISQLIDENKSRENRAVLQVPCALAQSSAYHTKQSLANHSRVDLHRAFALLPGRLGLATPSHEPGLDSELLPQESSCGGPRKGFASITITARRVGRPASALVWGTVRDALCTKCKAEDSLFGNAALSGGADLRQHHRPFSCTEFSRNGSVVRLKVPESHASLCEEHAYWVSQVDDKRNSFSPNTPPSGKGPVVFSSCVHLRVSRQCPNSVCDLDKSLSVPIEQPQIAGPKMHRSVLSLNLNCSSHRLTADGVDGIANREPISRALKQELTDGSQNPLHPGWSPGLQESHLKENPSLGHVPLGTVTCPWSSSSLLENTEFADAGADQVTVMNGKEDHATCHTGSHANELSIHIPGWSYTAGDYTCCDLVVKIKECKKSEDPITPEPSPASPSPAPCEEPETPDLSEDCSEPQQMPAHSLTLQEALEVRKPQFISRSQERLKKLEHMVQQRKSQQKEKLGQKQSLLPVRANKKQFTIPHPLSDNLFKPKERCISEKEMHMRSKRIYNNLPEVKKKKEEQRKRVILQSNRLRAEVFKKQLLDQLLQRNAV